VFAKQKRHEDRKLLDSYQEKKCLACGKTPTEGDHVITRGARGGDYDWNLIELCRRCHTLRHAKGLNDFTTKYPNVKKALLEKGWQYDSYIGRWYRNKD
jgi:5-methylcytosine-specific restriction endonuclease McrA